MHCLVGLGNHSDQYADTRHNIGFWVIEALSERHRLPLRKRKFRSLFAKGRLQDDQVILLKPQTYMNNSGRAVSSVACFHDLEPDQMLIIYDDIVLDLGELRLRRDGSAGGHRGMQDVIDRMGTKEIPRLRLGIGAPPEHMDARDYVLSRFPPEDHEAVEDLLTEAADAVELFLSEGIETAMNEIN